MTDDQFKTNWSDTWQSLTNPQSWYEMWNGRMPVPSQRQSDLVNNMGEGEKKFYGHQLLNDNGINNQNVDTELPKLLMQGTEGDNQRQQRARDKNTVLETTGSFVSPSLVDLLKNPTYSGSMDPRPYNAAVELGMNALGGAEARAVGQAASKLPEALFQIGARSSLTDFAKQLLKHNNKPTTDVNSNRGIQSTFDWQP